MTAVAYWLPSRTNVLHLRRIGLFKLLGPEAGRLRKRGDAVALDRDPCEDPVRDHHRFVFEGRGAADIGLDEDVLGRDAVGGLDCVGDSAPRRRRVRDDQGDRFRLVCPPPCRDLHGSDLEDPVLEGLEAVLVGERDARPAVDDLHRGRGSNAEVLAEFLHVGEDGIGVGLLSAGDLDVEDELGAESDAGRREVGTDLDVLCVGGGGDEGQGEEGEGSPDRGSPYRAPRTAGGAAKECDRHVYRASAPAGTTVIVNGWLRVVP